MSRIIKLDGLQVTMPLFDSSLLKPAEEMAAPVLSEARVFRQIAIKGGIPVKHYETDRRLFAVGSIRTNCRLRNAE